MRKGVLALFSVVSLLVCLAAPVLHFLGRLTNEKYRLIFLVASVAWFVFAILRSRQR